MTRSKPSTTINEPEFKMAADVYCPERSADDIADVACRILDDDGPKPMMRLRPAKKTPTAADQFEMDHQQRYEAYGARSRDQVYHAPCPLMRNELDKRQETGKVKITTARRTAGTQRRPRAGRSRRPKPRRRPRQRDKRSAPKASLRTIERRRISKLVSKRTLPIPKMAVEKGTLTCNELLAECEKSHSSQLSDDRTSKQRKPDTDASVSSYNSFPSIEHEPMISQP